MNKIDFIHTFNQLDGHDTAQHSFVLRQLQLIGINDSKNKTKPTDQLFKQWLDHSTTQSKEKDTKRQ